jgi:hypothetical protein
MMSRWAIKLHVDSPRHQAQDLQKKEAKKEEKRNEHSPRKYLLSGPIWDILTPVTREHAFTNIGDSRFRAGSEGWRWGREK